MIGRPLNRPRRGDHGRDEQHELRCAKGNRPRIFDLNAAHKRKDVSVTAGSPIAPARSRKKRGSAPIMFVTVLTFVRSAARPDEGPARFPASARPTLKPIPALEKHRGARVKHGSFCRHSSFYVGISKMEPAA